MQQVCSIGKTYRAHGEVGSSDTAGLLAQAVLRGGGGGMPFWGSFMGKREMQTDQDESYPYKLTRRDRQ